MSTLTVGNAVYKIIDYDITNRHLVCSCENYEASDLADMWINAATEKAISEFFLKLNVKFSYAEKWNLNKYADRFLESSNERLKILDKVVLNINYIENYDIYGLFLIKYKDKTQRAIFTFDRSYIKMRA